MGTEDEELERLLFAIRFGSITTLAFNAMGLDYVRFYEGVVEVERLYGHLPIFEIPDFFPEDRKKEILKYKLNELIDLKNIVTGMQNLLHLTEIPNDIIRYLLQKTKPPFSKQVETYLAYFELIYENYIIPIVERTTERPIVGYNNCISYVRNLLEELAKSTPSESRYSFFIEGLDGTLRNALVHKNYYIKEGILHYYQAYPRKKKVKFEQKPLEEFEKMVGFIFFQRWVFNIITGLRLGKISLTQVKQLSKTVRVSTDEEDTKNHEGS